MNSKQFKSLLLFFTLCAVSLNVCAYSVSALQARQMALKAINHYVFDFDGEVSDVETAYLSGHAVYHIVNFKPEGWIIISADNAVTPVLGYNTTGRLSLNDMCDNMRGWMRAYSDDISRYIRRGENTTCHSAWQSIELPALPTRASTDKVAELIKVKWNQGRPYNVYCPGGNTYVGCVAVAMAQAMSVAQYPPRPVGSFSYSSDNYGVISVDYDAQKPYNWSNILSGANGYDDVAKLLYHCGVSIKMDYTTSGSGTQTSYIPGALIRNFQYPSSVTYYSRSSYTGDWKALLVNELQSGRPVVYSGYPATQGAGHAFNLDGYDGNNMFHVNWGWSGQGNGFFTLDGLKDAHSNLDYTEGHGMVVGIRAPTEAPTDIYLDNTYVGENQPSGTVVGKLSVSSEAQNPVYKFSVLGPYSPVLHRRSAVPFEVIDGYLVTKDVLTRSKAQTYNIEITVTNANNNKSYTKSFTISVVDATAIGELKVDQRQQRHSVYDLSGRGIDAPASGLYIVDGRKVIVK